MLHVDQFADHHRSTDMRRNQPHPPARFVIGDPVALVTENAKHRDIGFGFIEHGADEID